MEYSSYLVSMICATGMNKMLQIYLIESDNFHYLITEENVRRFQASKQATWSEYTSVPYVKKFT